MGEGKGTPDWEGGVQEFWMKDAVQVVPGYVCRGRFWVTLLAMFYQLGKSSSE